MNQQNFLFLPETLQRNSKDERKCCQAQKNNLCKGKIINADFRFHTVIFKEDLRMRTANSV